MEVLIPGAGSYRLIARERNFAYTSFLETVGSPDIHFTRYNINGIGKDFHPADDCQQSFLC